MKKKCVFSEKKKIVSSEEVETIAPRCLTWGSCFMFSSRTSSPGVGEERAAVGGQSWWPSGPCPPTGCRCALLQRAPAHPEMRIPGLSPLAPPFASKVLTFCALGARRSGASGVRSSERSPACETDSPRSPSLCRQTHTRTLTKVPTEIRPSLR